MSERDIVAEARKLANKFDGLLTALAARIRNLTAERDRARSALAEAAQEINCAGPVAHRIRLLKREHEERLRALRAARDRYRDALVWALGAGDDFAPRPEGAGAYWWRTELQERPGLKWNGSEYVTKEMWDALRGDTEGSAQEP